MTDTPFKMIRCSGCGSEDACLCGVLGDSPMPPGYRKRLIEIGLLPADSPTPTGTGPFTHLCEYCGRHSHDPTRCGCRTGTVLGDGTINKLLDEFGKWYHEVRRDDYMVEKGFVAGSWAIRRVKAREEARQAIHAHISAKMNQEQNPATKTEMGKNPHSSLPHVQETE